MGAASLGALVIVGWAANAPMLRSLLPDTRPMVPNIAVGVLLLALALALLDGAASARRRAAAAGISAVVAAYGVTTIIEHLTAQSFAIDRLFFAQLLLAVDSTHPGRAALMSGIALGLVGGAQLTIAVSARRHLTVARTLATAALVISLAAAVNGLHPSTNAPSTAPTLGMALPTAVALGLLAAGTIALHHASGLIALFARRGLAGDMARQLLPTTLLAPPIIAAAVTLGKLNGWYDATIAVSMLLTLSMAVLLGLIVRQVAMVARIEDARNVAERREATTFDLAAVGVAHFDVEGRLLRANTRFAEMYRVAPSQIVGLNWHSFVIGERIPSSETLIALEKGEIPSVHVERPFLRGDGTEFWVRLSVSVARDAAGEAEYHIVVADDITERRRLEAESRALDLRVERVARLESIGVLASGVAHDFNNILAAILGNATFARAALPRGSALATHLDEVEHAARRAAELTSQLLAYAGKTERRPEPLVLEGLAADAARFFEPSVQPHVKLQVECAQAACVVGDAGQLRQVALALLTNAAEALAGRNSGHITLRTGAERLRATDGEASWWPMRPEDGEYAFLEVSDDGPGIDPAFQRQLFVPFASTKFLGRGLGLAAALGIARAHRGAFEVRSATGAGATLRVWLPLATAFPPSGA